MSNIGEATLHFLENSMPNIGETSFNFMENPMPLPLYYQVGSGFEVNFKSNVVYFLTGYYYFLLKSLIFI